MTRATGEVIENADIDREVPQPQIHVEERRLKLKDFLKTLVKINGSDLHLPRPRQRSDDPLRGWPGSASFSDCSAAG